ncbi:Hypothetical predicted protein [Marmota monax]|uniref:Membrane progestin receptor gamma n=1 Tax=Marmota monax TaxID=9995 RepID=A0A5E4B2R0_MARMO|nr:membrane progestin receptor gamma [Marmota monax]VTJ63685.1 Hypothetical predicted protein [Marmota monax]
MLCSRFFVWRFVTALYVTDIQNDTYSWPLLVYMCTSCVYPLASSCAHTFSCMSKNARHICYFLDYGAVNLFSLGMTLVLAASSLLLLLWVESQSLSSLLRELSRRILEPVPATPAHSCQNSVVTLLFCPVSSCTIHLIGDQDPRLGLPTEWWPQAVQFHPDALEAFATPSPTSPLPLQHPLVAAIGMPTLEGLQTSALDALGALLWGPLPILLHSSDPQLLGSSWHPLSSWHPGLGGRLLLVSGLEKPLCAPLEWFPANTSQAAAALESVVHGSAIAYSAYTFPEALVQTPFHDYYIVLAVLNTILSTGLSCYSRFLEIQKPRLCKVLRVLAFAYPYTWDSLPIFYRLFLFPDEDIENEATLYHQKHVVMTLLASVLYSAHLPECLAPGCFDYIGHSHQLFHVCVILATHLQMEAILLDKTLRKEWLMTAFKPFSFSQIAVAVMLCLIFSLSNIIYFSAALYRIPEPELHKKET